MNVTIEIPDEINQQLDNIKNLNSFIVELLNDYLENKQKIVVNDDVIKLTVQQQKNFVESLLNPEPPNDKLKKIAETYLIKTDE